MSARELRRCAGVQGARPAIGRSLPLARTRARAVATALISLLAIAAAGAEAEPLAADSPTEITADRLEYREEGQVYVAEGDVTIHQRERSLSADWVAFSLATRRGVASGHVRIRDVDQTVEADFVHFDLDTLVGVLFDARIDTGASGFRVDGREMHRLSDREYRLREGGFTSCRCPEEDDRLPWRVDTATADLELGGYGHARNSTVEVLGVPIAWLPWILFPMKTERETGLLLPDLAFGGRNGTSVGLPLFIAARDDLGVILTPRYMQKRGYGLDVETDYVLGEHSGGRIRGAYVRDKEVVKGQTPYGPNRWGVQIEHDQFLPGGFRARVDVKAVSDNAYLDDFDDYAVFRRDLFLRSTAFAFGQFGSAGRVGVVGALRFADDIQSPLDQGRDDTLLHRMPDLSLRVLPGSSPLMRRFGLVPSLDTDFTYFYQRNDPQSADPLAALGPDGTFLDAGIDPARGALDPTRGDGVFQPGEPMLEDGSRFILRPRLARPVSLGGFADFTPEVGYAQALYDGSRRGFAESGVFSARADLRSRWIGERSLSENLDGEHRLEPFVRYTWVKTRNQASTPIFVPRSAVDQDRLRQLDPESYVLDPSDRVPGLNLISIGLDNTFRIGNRGGGPDPLRSDFWLSFEHDFNRGDTGRMIAGGRGYWRRYLSGRANLSWDLGRGEIDEGLLGLRVGLKDYGMLRSPYLDGRYRFLRKPPQIASLARNEVNQLDVGLGFRLGERLLIRYSLAYSLDDGARLAQTGTVIYASRCKCFSIGFDIVEDRTRDVFFRVRYSITGLGDRAGDPFSATQGLFSNSAY